jgi:NADPH:quinone reductase-like Zn-dependent oxidoreductase/acyl carrier protein
VARLRAGERVLILGAAGGVGLAAVQAAQQAGAEVVATAGTAEKRDLLRSRGVALVLDSRAASLSSDLRAAAAGAAFDVLMDCTPSADLTMADLLAPGGRWCTLANEGRALPPGRNRAGVAIDLAALAAERPALIATLLREVISDFIDGRLPPLPTRARPLAEASAVFRGMAERRQVGKNVLTMSGGIAVAPPRGGVRSDASYLVTGGLGGLGLVVARWLIERGARSLILIGRRPPSAEAAARLEELRAVGARVEIRCADVSDAPAIEAVVGEIEHEMPPLAGVVHAAGMLDDGILFQQTRERLRAVMAPKVQGAWNLHASTADCGLDFFILFSSAASLVGSPGQGNYTAANSFLDALAHHRCASGLPGLSINWGPWSEVGMAAEASRAANMATAGIDSLTPGQGVAALQRLLRGSPAQVGVMALNLPQWQRRYPRIAELPLLAELMEGIARDADEQNQVREALLTLATDSAREAYLEKYLREQLGEVLGLDPLRIDPQAPLLDLGFDSLMMVELKNRLERGLGVGLSPTMVFNYPTVAMLAPQLGRLMGLPAGELAEPPADTAADQRLAALSEEEAEALLNARLDEWEGREGVS